MNQWRWTFLDGELPPVGHKKSLKVILEILLGLVVLLPLVFSGTSSQAKEMTRAPQNVPFYTPLASGEIILVAHNLVDLRWDPASYPPSPVKLLWWELDRDTTPNPSTRITFGRDNQVGYYRDHNLSPGVTYYYALKLIQCLKEPCDQAANRRVVVFFSDSVTTGVFQGQVTKDLTLGAFTYEIGFGGVGDSAAVYVDEGARLSAGSSTIITVKPTIDHSTLIVKQGSVDLNGTTLRKTSLALGDYYQPTSRATGTLQSVTLEDSNLSLYGMSQLTLTRSQGNFSIFASFQSQLTAKDNSWNGSINIDQQAQAFIERNTIRDGKISVSGYSAQGSPKARAYITGNTLSSAYTNQGIEVSYGASVDIISNQLSWSGYHGSESSVLVMISDQDSQARVLSNRVENGKIGVFWGAQVEIRDNVLNGGGAAITVGCVVCGSNTQAVGNISGNTLKNGWGLEMWAGSQELVIRDNCLFGNNPGLTVDA